MAQHMTHTELKEINNKPNTLLSATISCFPAGENAELLRKAMYIHP